MAEEDIEGEEPQFSLIGKDSAAVLGGRTDEGERASQTTRGPKSISDCTTVDELADCLSEYTKSGKIQAQWWLASSKQSCDCVA